MSFASSIFLAQSAFAQAAPAPALADPASPVINTAGKDALNFLDDVAEKSGLGKVESAESATMNIIGNVINIALGFIGVIFFILVFWAGVRWMTSAGNEEVVKEAKNTIKTSVIGIAVVFLAFLFTNFVLRQIGDIAEAPASTGDSAEIYGLCSYAELADGPECESTSACTLKKECEDMAFMEENYNACDVPTSWRTDPNCE